MRSFAPIVATLAGILAPLMAIAAASGQALKPSTTIKETSLRKAPRTDGEILAVIPRGTTPVAGDCHGGWCGVSWNGQAGYATDPDLRVAEPRGWPNLPAVGRVGDDVPSQWTGMSFPKREEGKENGHEDSGPEHRWILEVGTAGESVSTGSARILVAQSRRRSNPSKTGWSWNTACRRRRPPDTPKCRAIFCSRSRSASLLPLNLWLAVDRHFRAPSMARNSAIRGLQNSRWIGCSGRPEM